VVTRRVLVIEDNASLLANLFSYLEPRGYMLDAARDGMAGAELAAQSEYDALVIDWMLPRMEGTDIVRRLRDAGSAVPILMLTARDELEDKITGFNAGADDYLTKPFALAELDARLGALIARARGRQRVLQVADLRFNLSTESVTRNAQPIRLHAGCRKLLGALMRASPAVVPRRQLEILLWGEQPPDGDMLRSHMYELRKAIDGPFTVKLLQTIARVGYRLATLDESHD
jgi:DNA-binding response OmpR family regulator